MSQPSRYQRLCDEIRDEFPRFRVVVKSESSLHRGIDIALKILTLGGMRSYLNGYQTTIGQRVYVTDDWTSRSDDERYVTMRHELVHLRQFRRWTLPGMALIYLLLPLPMGLAYGRARLEWEGYRETVRATAEVFGLEAVEKSSFRQYILRQFTGPSYGWMWPFRGRVEAWLDSEISSVRREFGNAPPG